MEESSFADVIYNYERTFFHDFLWKKFREMTRKKFTKEGSSIVVRGRRFFRKNIKKYFGNHKKLLGAPSNFQKAKVSWNPDHFTMEA